MQFLAAIALILAADTQTAAGTSTLKVNTGELVERIACLADPSQTYTLYLPTSYTTDARWPVLLIFDPRGRSVHAAERFQAAAERWGWVLLSSNDTRSDGPWDPNVKAIEAMWPELESRYAVDPRRVYASGMSGGGHVAYLLGKTTGSLAGVMVSGSRLLAEYLEGTTFAVFAAAGDRDFNYWPMRDVDGFVAELGNPHRFEAFPGLHQWMPAELAAESVAWMELVAMQRGLRPRDEAVIRDLYAGDLEAARALEAEGSQLEAMRRYEMMVRTYEGLSETSAAAEAARRLAAERDVKRALKDERKWQVYEETTRLRFADAYRWTQQGETPPTAAELKVALGLRSLEKHAEQPGLEGLTAQRLLSTLYAETSYYIGPPLLQAGRAQAAAAVLTVATEIHDGWGSAAPTWYNLACAQALAGHRRDAVHAIRRAVEAGFTNAEHLRSDPDLASLHGLEDFQAILDELEHDGQDAAATTGVTP